MKRFFHYFRMFSATAAPVLHPDVFDTLGELKNADQNETIRYMITYSSWVYLRCSARSTERLLHLSFEDGTDISYGDFVKSSLHVIP